MKPYYHDEAVCIYHGDCRDVFAAGVLPKVDHAIFDPPYSEHVHASQRRGLTAHAGVISERRDLGFASLDEPTREIVSGWCASRVARWTIAFSDTESSHLWRASLCQVGLEHIRTAFWHKVGGAPQFTGDRPAVACEAITICHPIGRKRWNGGGRQGLYQVPIVLSRGGSNEVRVHTTQKPIGLMLQLVSDFTDPGESVIDPFMGSGTTLVAAKRLGRKAIGIEREQKYCELAVERLAQGSLGLGVGA